MKSGALFLSSEVPVGFLFGCPVLLGLPQEQSTFLPRFVLASPACAYKHQAGLFITSCLDSSCNKHCTRLHRNLLSEGWFHYVQASWPKLGLVTVWVEVLIFKPKGSWLISYTMLGSCLQQFTCETIVHFPFEFIYIFCTSLFRGFKIYYLVKSSAVICVLISYFNTFKWSCISVTIPSY